MSEELKKNNWKVKENLTGTKSYWYQEVTFTSALCKAATIQKANFEQLPFQNLRSSKAFTVYKLPLF